jgi:hypothetical protein
MSVAVLSLMSTPVTINVTLTRDGCASLTCSAPYASRCLNGVCQCNRFVYNNPSGILAEVCCCGELWGCCFKCPRASGTTRPRSWLELQRPFPNRARCAHVPSVCPLLVPPTVQYGFAGSLCQSLDCPGQPDCSGRGTCVLSSVTNQPQCACKSRYNGTECEKLNSGANALVDLAAAAPFVSSIIAGNVVNVNITSPRSGFTVVGKATKADVKIREAYTLVFLVTSPMSLVRRARGLSPS